MIEDLGRPGVRRSRVYIDALVRLRSDQGQWQTPVLDASMSGLRAERPEGFELPEATAFDAKLVVEGRTLPALPVTLSRLGERDMALTFSPLSIAAEHDLAWMIDRFGRLADAVDVD